MGKAEIAPIAPFFVVNDVPAAWAFYRGVEPVPNYTRDVKKGIARWGRVPRCAGPRWAGRRVHVARHRRPARI